jgi:hypothetical protein
MAKRIKATVKMMFQIIGSKYTAIEINRFLNISDARKVISDLRNEGMPIRDFRNKDNSKTYYLGGLDNGK